VHRGPPKTAPVGWPAPICLRTRRRESRRGTLLRWVNGSAHLRG
jgi:hypothetical protein